MAKKKTLKLTIQACARFCLFVFCVAMLWEHALIALIGALVARGRCGAALLLSDTDCYAANNVPYRMYSTHTDYEDVRGHGEDFALPGCVPKKLYLISRHGIRYPTTSNFGELSRLLPSLHSILIEHLANGTLCPLEQSILREWRFGLDSSKAEMLSDTGRQEAYDLGLRFQHRFPDLVGQPYSPERYAFRHTYKPRTADTARAIAMGMFNQSDFSMVSKAKGCDPLLRFYKICDKYAKTVYDQPATEESAFRRGAEISGVINNVAQRLGVSNESLSFDVTYALYEICSFEHAILRRSAVCLLFSRDDLRVLEYWRDLMYYWQSGYGHSINYEQTCNLVKDILGYLGDPCTNITGMIRVAHDSTLMPLYARLGLFHDTTHLTARNMADQADRKWRTSSMSGFGSNLAFVNYECGKESKVRVFHNEKPIALPMCPASGCMKSDILNSYLGSFAKKCDFGKTCQYNPKHICNGHVTTTGACVPTIIG